MGETDPGIHIPGDSSGGEPGRGESTGGPGDDGSTGDEGPGPGPDPDPDTGSTGEPGGGDGPPPCDVETFELEVEAPQVVLLLDKSYSMVDNLWDHDGDPMTPPVTRWNSLYTVVDTVSHDIQGGAELGMMLFPSDSLTDNGVATACVVDPAPNAAVAPLNADAIIGAMPGPEALDLFSGTPASAGMTVVLDHLATVADGRPQAVLLVTDGAANCMPGMAGEQVFTEYDEDLGPLVAQAYADGIPTYVVGVDIVDEVGVYPQANPYERLSEIAMAGGVPNMGGGAPFYNTTDELSLLGALEGITAELSCTLELDASAEFADQITVWIGGQEIPRVEACMPEGAGWRYLQDAAPYTSIELCPATCDLAHEAEQLSLDYACIPPG